MLHHDRYDQSFILRGQNQCALQLSPCSTFKIPNALIGVVTDPDHLKTWDGADKGRTPHGWYVGWMYEGARRNPATNWFVVNMQGDGAFGFVARDFAIAKLEQRHKEP